MVGDRIDSESEDKSVPWWVGCTVGEKEQSLMTPGCLADTAGRLGQRFAEMGKMADGAGLWEGRDWALGMDVLPVSVSISHPGGHVSRTAYIQMTFTVVTLDETTEGESVDKDDKKTKP